MKIKTLLNLTLLLVIMAIYSTSNTRTLGADERPLTAEEKQAIEYVLTSIYDMRDDKEFVRANLCEALSEITLVDKGSWCIESILAYPMTSFGYHVSVGETHVYQVLPPPNSTKHFPILAHETLHTLQQELAGDTVHTYLIPVVFGLWTDGYRSSPIEIPAYATENTIREMLKDPDFRNAVQNGTTSELPEYYRELIRCIYHTKMMDEHARAAAEKRRRVDEAFDRALRKSVTGPKL